jgi:hypothetical protein
VFAEDLLPAVARVDEPCALAVEIRLNWYRALPLSCIEDIALTVDGEPVERERLSLRLRGDEIPVARLGEHADRWWNVLDAPELVARGDVAVAAGEHDVELAITVRIPYFGPLPDGSFVTMTDRTARRVTA